MVVLHDLTTDESLLYHAMSYARSFRDSGTVGSDVGREFEEGFYERITRDSRFRLISRSHDLGLGHELSTTSGIRHETDAVLTDDTTLYVCELKHYFEGRIDKEMLVVFNHKVIDFYLELIRQGRNVRVKRLFLTRSPRLENFTREFAMSWGIGLVDGEIWPPLLLRLQMQELSSLFPQNPIEQEWWFLAEDLCKRSFRDLSDIMFPYSPMQVTINTNDLLGPHECIRLVENHHRLFKFVGELYKCHQ